MKQPITSRNAAFIIGGLLTLPAACFFIVSILNFQLGYPFLYDAANPFLESTSTSERAGFNIYLLILFGPVLALMINVLAVLDLWLDHGKDRINFQLSLGKKPGPPAHHLAKRVNPYHTCGLSLYRNL